jgi:hypothetical protein
MREKARKIGGVFYGSKVDYLEMAFKGDFLFAVPEHS